MKECIQILASFAGALGFSLIFGLHGKQLPVVAAGSACTWLCYLVVRFFGGGALTGLFLASLFGSFYVAIAVGKLKIPKTVLLFPVLISLVPGSNLYLTMRYAVDGNFPLFLSYGVDTLSATFAIAMGIIIMLVCQQLKQKIHKKP